MKIGIIGTRGIPNNYGGFEQLAQYLSLGLVNKGHHVTVYNSTLHPFQESVWNGVSIVHCKDPEDKFGTVGQFIYDYNCFSHAKSQNFDVLINLGYTSSSFWLKMIGKKTKLITNMDGLEWKRSKYNGSVKRFLKYAEKQAANNSNILVADSIAIQDYLLKKYNKKSHYIAYGAAIFEDTDKEIISQFNLIPFEYYLIIARLEPENNIEMALDGYILSKSKFPFLIIGNHKTKYGSFLTEKYQQHKSIQFLGPIYDLKMINNLRFYTRMYFHGHSVGGTNPSLIEAMACSANIASHHNEFNKGVLNSDAYFFSNNNEVADIINHEDLNQTEINKKNNLVKIKKQFSWPFIIDAYENVFR